jgi:hypothetical protein
MVARHPAGRGKPYDSLIREACSFLNLVGRRFALASAARGHPSRELIYRPAEMVDGGLHR